MFPSRAVSARCDAADHVRRVASVGDAHTQGALDAATSGVALVAARLDTSRLRDRVDGDRHLTPPGGTLTFDGMNSNDLTDQLAVVTGGSRGIGYHTARHLHEAGCRVAITGRTEAALNDAAARIGERCSAYVCDQRDPAQVEAVARRIRDDLGPPMILVANAAAFGGGAVQNMDLETWNKVIETNLTGTMVTCRAFLPAMIERGRGDVFILSSMSGKRGDPGAAAYAASKFGLQGLAQAMNHDVRRHNIRVMVLNPSGVNTELEDTAPPHGPGQKLHAADLGALIVNLAELPGRTLVRDMDIWATNPFS